MTKPLRSSLLHIILLLSVLLLIAIGNAQNVSPAVAQAVNLSWEKPDRIPGIADARLQPVLLSDPSGAIHLFNSQLAGESLRVFYIRWTPEGGWGKPVDIITAPLGGARVYGACIDEAGWVHLAFFGGNDREANFYYTKAPLRYAGRSTSWTEPKLIGKMAITPSMGSMVGDGKGFLQVIYSGKLSGNGLYAVQSFDHGETWSSAEPIFLTYNDELWPSALKILLTPDGKVYAAWSVSDVTGNGQSLHFIALDVQHQRWTHPIVIDKVSQYEVDTPSMVQYDGRLLLTYHNGFPTTQWMRISRDHGETWSQPVRLFSQVGGNGPASFAVDSDNNLHMLFGGRVGEPAIHGAWHSIWLGDQWSNPEAIVSGRQILVGPGGEEGFDPTYLQAVICRGNLLFVTWKHDPMAGPLNIWFSYQMLNTPPHTPATLPHPSSPEVTHNSLTIPPESKTPPPQLTLTPTAIENTYSDSSQPPTNAYDPNIGLLLGILVVLGLMAIWMIYQFIKNNHL